MANREFDDEHDSQIHEDNEHKQGIAYSPPYEPSKKPCYSPPSQPLIEKRYAIKVNNHGLEDYLKDLENQTESIDKSNKETGQK